MARLAFTLWLLGFGFGFSFNSSHVLDGYGYTHDPLGWRTNFTRDLGLTTNFVAIGYDAIGQLTSWSAKESDNRLRWNEQLGFTYDSAGNLRSRTDGYLQQTFGADALNQLTNIVRSGTLTFSGQTPAPANTVTVNGGAAERYGDFTFARTNNTLSEGPNPFSVVAQSVTGTFITSNLTINLPTTVTNTYDASGNLSSDGTRWFEYDAENQLTAVMVPNAWRSQFIYDGLGRRRVSTDSKWQSGTWSQTNETHFVYDGMVVLQERDAASNPRVTYTRGVDLGGGFQTAGGIGGLLARTDGTGSAYYHSDGAGNVTTLTDSQQTVAARYLYGPFGRLVGKWGPLADTNAMQFSSMPRHANSGLSLYAFRAYDPTLQRWLTRDPIGERGGINLYGFVGNNPLRYVDPYGLSWYGDLFNYVGDKELEVGDAIKGFFLGNGVQLRDPDTLRAGSGLIEPLRDEFGNDITRETLGDIAAAVVLGAMAGPEREGASIFGDVAKCKKLGKLGDAAETVANPVPGELARVVAGDRTLTTLGRPGASDVFVVAADDIAGLNSAQLAQRLTIPASDTFTIIRFPTPAEGLASPVFRNNPGFLQGGLTRGGAREFVLPNGPIPAGATRTIVRP